MARLIDSLLVFSRIETRARPHQLVNMGTLVQEALEDLKPLLEEAQAQVLVRAEEMPALIGEPSQLRSLWINLISNAVKYRKPNEPPRVEIGHCEEATEYIFFVRDNGQGIAPEFQEEIFRLFRRLHPESEVPGTGMGLAICRRVVERHEGRIWVESSPGEGATFYFALPKKSAPSTLAEPIPTFP
ncbi:MAG: hypothetical protein KatS3mg115_0858 [Candidatus Poribacteria bacterium]|nr:MAG: hypothetical protein KatS3mg115_0858 [Candidatus Poribacteria bacterium]